MTQALHIVGKDVRRLWPIIAGALVLFGLLASSNETASGAGLTSLVEWGNLLPFLVAMACWLLGASVVQEDAPAQESPFWLTRPYNRGSLLVAKVIFLSAFVLVPLLLSGIVLEVRAGVSVVGNAVPFLAIELGYALWLILPALAVGAVTRSLTSFEGALFALFILRYSPGRWFVHPTLEVTTPLITDALALLPMLLAAVVVVGLQYAIRSTVWSRVMLVGSVIASGILMPLEGVAVVTMHALNGGFEPGRIQVSFDETARPVSDNELNTCWSLAVKVAGLPRGAVLSEIGTAKSEIQADLEGIRKVDRATFDESGGGYRELVCNVPYPPGPADRWINLSQDLRVTQDFAVVSTEKIATMPVRHGSLAAGDVGRCEFLTPFPENTQLRCVLAEPVVGAIAAGLEFPGFRAFSGSFVRPGMFGLSPVYRARFDGESQTRHSGWPLDLAENRSDARFVLRKELVIGTVRREFVYHHLVFPWQVLRLPPSPRSK